MCNSISTCKMFHQLLSNWFPNLHMFNLRRLQSCLENNACDFLSVQEMFSPCFFFCLLFLFGLCQLPVSDGSSRTYGRDWLQAHSCTSRHAVPLYLFINLTKSLRICAFWTQIFEGQEKKKSIDQSLYRLILFFAVLWCCPGQLHMTVTGRFSAGTVPVWDPMPSSSPMQIVQLCSCSIIMIR